MAATAKPDGYTVAQIPITIFRFPFMTKTAFDPAKDFSYIIGVSGYTFGVVVKNDAPWKTFAELLADAKANPGKINYGTPGAGTSLHITMEQIAKRQGIKWTHVPFKGNAETSNAILGESHPRGRRFERLGAIGQCRPVATAGDLGRKPHQELAGGADPAGGRHRPGLELAVRHRRAEGDGGEHHQAAA